MCLKTQIRGEDRCSLKGLHTFRHHWSLLAATNGTPDAPAELLKMLLVRADSSNSQHFGAERVKSLGNRARYNMLAAPSLTTRKQLHTFSYPVLFFLFYFFYFFFFQVLSSRATTVFQVLVWSFEVSSFREQNVTIHYFKGPRFNLLPFWSCSAKYKLYVPNIAFTWLNKQTR